MVLRLENRNEIWDDFISDYIVSSEIYDKLCSSLQDDIVLKKINRQDIARSHNKHHINHLERGENTLLTLKQGERNVKDKEYDINLQTYKQITDILYNNKDKKGSESFRNNLKNQISQNESEENEENAGDGYELIIRDILSKSKCAAIIDTLGLESCFILGGADKYYSVEDRMKMDKWFDCMVYQTYVKFGVAEDIIKSIFGDEFSNMSKDDFDKIFSEATNVNVKAREMYFAENPPDNENDKCEKSEADIFLESI